MMNLAAQLRALVAQSTEPAAFLEEAEPLYRHAVALRPQGRIFKQHRWQQHSAVTLQPRGGSVTRREALMFSVTRGEALMFPLPAAPSPGVAAQPRPCRWDWRWRRCHGRPQRWQRRRRRHNTTWVSGSRARFPGDARAVSAVGGANSGEGWSKARRRACGSSRERDGWAWHSCVAMA
uniref:Uncharacterized protein n=1 Tax=Oryza rufipogon TaxID=4529 RepID=A0A0E0MWF5_ORYRU